MNISLFNIYFMNFYNLIQIIFNAYLYFYYYINILYIYLFVYFASDKQLFKKFSKLYLLAKSIGV